MKTLIAFPSQWHRLEHCWHAFASHDGHEPQMCIPHCKLQAAWSKKSRRSFFQNRRRSKYYSAVLVIDWRAHTTKSEQTRLLHIHQLSYQIHIYKASYTGNSEASSVVLLSPLGLQPYLPPRPRPTSLLTSTIRRQIRTRPQQPRAKARRAPSLKYAQRWLVAPNTLN